MIKNIKKAIPTIFVTLGLVRITCVSLALVALILSNNAENWFDNELSCELSS